MKKYFCLLALLASLFPARTQEIFEYRALLNGSSMVPPNESPNTFEGTYRLDGLIFYYSVPFFNTSFTPSSASIFGPALAGQTGPEIFALDRGFVAPYNSVDPDSGASYISPSGYTFFGNRTLSQAEADQLNSGQWYMVVNTTEFSSGELRGQILAVPEPATTVLLAAGLAFLAWAGRGKKAARHFSP